MGKLLSLLFCISFFVTVWSQSFNLNVSNGFGTGTYNEGDTIYIWANPNFQNYSFTSWQGSATNYMLESNEWLTRIIVPQNSNVGTINASSQFVDLSSNVITGNETISLPGMNNGIQVPTTKEIYYVYY